MLLLFGFYKITSVVYAVAEAMVKTELEEKMKNQPDMTEEEMFRRLKENHERRQREMEESK